MVEQLGAQSRIPCKQPVHVPGGLSVYPVKTHVPQFKGLIDDVEAVKR